jgi:hypothetical protein
MNMNTPFIRDSLERIQLKIEMGFIDGRDKRSESAPIPVGHLGISLNPYSLGSNTFCISFYLERYK